MEVGAYGNIYCHSFCVWHFFFYSHSSSPSSLSELVDCYNTTLTDILNKHAPLKAKRIHSKSPNPWFTSKLRALKTSCRCLQKVCARSHSAFDLQRLRSVTNKCHAAIIKAMRSFHASSVSSNITNPRKLWATVNKILHRKISNSLPTCLDSTFL